MKKNFFENVLKTTFFIVFLSFIFSCQKKEDISQLTETSATVPVFNGQNKSITNCYIVNRWKNDQYLLGMGTQSFFRGYYPFRVDTYTPLTYTYLHEVFRNQGYQPFIWEVKIQSGVFYRIKNTWSEYILNTENTSYQYPELSSAGIDWWSAQWSLEYAGSNNGVNYWRIKNRWTNKYLNIEHLTGYVECTTINNTWESAQWELRFL